MSLMNSKLSGLLYRWLDPMWRWA